MNLLTRLFLLALLVAALVFGQEGKLRYIAFGAHPDDCDIRFGGTAAKLAKAGNMVKFVSVTNGDAGHQEMGGASLARRRYAETQESARRLGIAEYEVFDNHDGELMPTLEIRKDIIRAIREWKADVVLAPRPNDYHPDHRYTGVLVQDAAYMVMVPNIAADVPPLRKNPVFIYYQDRFQKPAPFRPDVAVAIDDVWDTKVSALDAHVSQVYEWLPWVDGRLDQVPTGKTARLEWLKKWRKPKITPEIRAALEKRYGKAAGDIVKYYEAFELCEYGRQPDGKELSAMFPK